MKNLPESEKKAAPGEEIFDFATIHRRASLDNAAAG